MTLGTHLQRNGQSQYNAIWEFESEVQGERVHMKVTSVTGHLMELDFAEPYTCGALVWLLEFL
jgi:DNA topoisomerase-3